MAGKNPASSEKKRASDEVEKPKLKAEDDVVAAVWNKLKAQQQAVTQLDAGNDAESDCKSEKRLRLVAAARAGTTKTAQEGKRNAAQAAGTLMKAENEAGGGAAAQKARTTWSKSGRNYNHLAMSNMQRNTNVTKNPDDDDQH